MSLDLLFIQGIQKRTFPQTGTDYSSFKNKFVPEYDVSHLIQRLLIFCVGQQPGPEQREGEKREVIAREPGFASQCLK